MFKNQTSFNEEIKHQDINDEENYLRQMPIIIAVSGNISDEDIKRGEEVGFDDFSKSWQLPSNNNVL